MSKRVSIYSAATEMQAEFLVQVLGSHGIEATTTGSALAPLMGYLPATYARTRVLVDEAEVASARAIVEDFERSQRNPRGPAGESWVCSNCGEIIEAQFTDCWNCQTARGESSTADSDAKAQQTPAH